MNDKETGLTMKRMAISALAVLLSGCGASQWFARGESVSVDEVGRAQLCSDESDDAALQVFASGNAVAQWQQRTGIDLHPSALQPGRYALIQMGQRHTGGYGIAVSGDATRVDSVLKLYATFFAPAQGAMTTQMITSPCVLVQLPPGGYDTVEVYDQTGAVRAAASVSTSP
ncbi:protease complex subunit PrcB family protein [Sinimarinibacterium sp. CAU 1509]|uniref:protease complex subunit PrcB family protein n=1 Tax=Sinimarinibacterium sp. CAU 1509 TaxID=2562283 RepID=UPI0010ABF715|nr:protease complex subunit PrcB family protein [Sinimarinibacterium sp. CAU 1509]TJY59378.1 protease complex subunit PrcB family protein [Sinimarinibacterium sp. CAU 1509]